VGFILAPPFDSAQGRLSRLDPNGFKPRDVPEFSVPLRGDNRGSHSC